MYRFIFFFLNLPWTQSSERLISLSEVKWSGMHMTKIPLWKACENLNILKTQMLRRISSWASYVWWRDQRGKVTFSQSSAAKPRLVTSPKQESMPPPYTLGKQPYLEHLANESPRALLLERLLSLTKGKTTRVVLTCLFERLREEWGVQFEKRQGGYILPSLRVSAHTRHCAEWLSRCLR